MSLMQVDIFTNCAPSIPFETPAKSSLLAARRSTNQNSLALATQRINKLITYKIFVAYIEQVKASISTAFTKPLQNAWVSDIPAHTQNK